MARRDIAGLRVIVTGASSGIGRSLVVELVHQGASVVAMARREERLRDLEAEASAGDRFAWIGGDVTRREDRAAAIDLCGQRFGGLDALVNNAGFGAQGPFAAADEARLRSIFEVNLFAAAEFIREALPHLRLGNHAIIVNVGSVLGHTAVPGKSEYCASKFALHGLSDALRMELVREDIDVLLVSPSTTSSEFFDRMVAASVQPEPSKRFGAMTPDAVARRIVAAMRRGRREIILSAGGKALVWLDRLCPPLAQWFISRWR
jgi:short-subunit dehydrogenase